MKKIINKLPIWKKFLEKPKVEQIKLMEDFNQGAEKQQAINEVVDKKTSPNCH